MSSWYVKYLIINSSALGLSENYDTVPCYNEQEDYEVVVNVDFYNDIYLDLLSIESKFERLVSQGMISEEDKNVITLLMDSGTTIKYVCSEMGLSRPTVYKILNSVADKISFSLGGHFTDDGFIDYMSEKYSLDSDEIRKLKNIIVEETYDKEN